MRRNRTQSVCVSLLIAALSSFLSCSDVDVNQVRPSQQAVEVGFYAGGTQTRTEMLPNGLDAVWESGDVVSLWAKDASGNFTLYNQNFTTYGLNGMTGFFTSKLDAPMPEGTYTYYCTHPAPIRMEGVSAIRAVFNIPSVQDGRASGGADIMISDPTTGPALNAVNLDEEEGTHNDVSLAMHRLTHQLRFWIPKGQNVLGEPINRIDIEMHSDYEITGEFHVQLADRTWTDLTNGSNTLTLNLDKPLEESEYTGDDDEADFAHAVICPYSISYPLEYKHYMQLTVYTNSWKSKLDRISLYGRTFSPGHSTPVCLLPTAPTVYASIRLKTGHNYLGEALWSMSLSSDGNQLLRYDNTAGTYHNVEYLKEYNGETEKAEFDVLINGIKDAVNNGTVVANLESQSASIDIPVTEDMLTIEGNNAVIDLGDIPYLLYEDFDGVAEYAKGDAYDASFTDNTNDVTGYLLDGYLSDNGWNAARFGLGSDRVRISCLYEGAVFAYRKYCGRLDTPALKWLKPGVTANVVIEYDRAFVIPAGYNIDTTEPMARYYVGHHKKSQTSKTDGIDIYDNDNAIRNDATLIYDGKLSDGTTERFGNEGVKTMTHVTRTIEGVDCDTRIVFYVATDETDIGFLGMNSCYYLNLDNIKVYIKQ